MSRRPGNTSVGLSAPMLGLVVAVTACTSTETDPRLVTWGDLMGSGHDRLDAHVESRRSELRATGDRASEMEGRLAERQQELDRLDRDLEQASARSAKANDELESTLRQISLRQRELMEAQRKLAELSAEAARLEATMNKSRESARAHARYALEIETLEKEVDALDSVIEGLLRTRAKFAVESS